jgi:hypothetical protein
LVLYEHCPAQISFLMLADSIGRNLSRTIRGAKNSLKQIICPLSKNTTQPPSPSNQTPLLQNVDPHDGDAMRRGLRITSPPAIRRSLRQWF